MNGETYSIPSEFGELRATIARMARERIAPRAREIDERSEYPRDILDLLAENDILALPFPSEFGGMGTGTLMLSIAIEEIAKACASSALILMVQELGTLPIQLFGSSAVKDRYLPLCATGALIPAFALSEPEAGSDPAALRTTARRDGTDWVLNGTKAWISNASVADFYVVFATTDREARRTTAFVVDADTPGLSIGGLEKKMGIRGSPTGSPVFEDVRIPAENVIGEVDEGLRVALATLERTRLGAAAQATGLAQGATDYANRYALERETFGHPIHDHQAIGFRLAEMEARTAAGRELLYRAAAAADRSEPDLPRWTSMAKLVCSDTAMWVTTEAVQVLGGYGYVSEYPVERMMRDAKVTQIYEGTNEIQRLVISRAMRQRAAQTTP